MKKTAGYIKLLLPIIILAAALVNLLFFQTEAHYFPGYEKTDIASVAEETLSDEGYREIFYQTGLSKAAANKVLEDLGPEGLLSYQERFFADINTETETFNFNVTRQEFITGDSDPADIAWVEKGDIIITLASNTLFFNHGHAGLVVSVSPDLVLEAVSPGNSSWITDLNYWRRFSNFIILRLKDSAAEEREKIALYAGENLVDIPYGITAGVFKRYKEAPERTQCASIIWEAYKPFNYDIDSDGGRIVTVKDILESEKLGVVQIYGLNPGDYINRMY